jgi:hypothetical protein
MSRNIWIVMSVVMLVCGIIQALSYFTGNSLALVQAFASFTFSYAMNIQVQVYDLREKLAKLSL